MNFLGSLCPVSGGEQKGSTPMSLLASLYHVLPYWEAHYVVQMYRYAGFELSNRVGVER